MLKELWHTYKKKWWVWGGIVTFLISTFLLSYYKGDQVYTTYTDFSCIYTAGWHFINGMPLYGEIYSHIVEYLYPPFSAMLFSALAILKPETAFSLFCFLNIMLIGVNILLIFKLLDHLKYNKKVVFISVGLAFLFSFRFHVSNFNLGQVNLIVIFILLLGILSFIKRNYVGTAILFSFIAVFKVIPAVFLVWLILVKFRKDVIIASLLSLIVFMGLPILVRGVDQGYADFAHFINEVFFPYMFDSSVRNYHTNQSLSAALTRLLTENDTTIPFSLNIFTLKTQTVNIINLVAKIIISIPFFIIVFQQIRKKLAFNITTLSFILIYIHLVSSVTWRNHEVDLMIALIPLFSLKFKDLNKISKGVFSILIVLLIILMFSYKVLIGNELKVLLYGLNLNTLFLLMAYFFYLRILFFPKTVFKKDISYTALADKAV
jgi:hypothetical protein